MSRRLPTEKAIRSYWCEHLWEAKGFDSPEEFMEDGICFACGWNFRGLQRCHIVPRVLGGSCKPDNLHMLCDLCHKDSEYLDGIKYWEWLFSRTMFDLGFSAMIRLKGSGVNVWTDLIRKMAFPERKLKNEKAEFV